MDSGPHVQTMSARKRYMLFGVACTHVLLASGEAYGWTALRPVLLDDGLFDGSDPGDRAAKMNSVATMGIAANALCKFPLGLLLDRCGPRATALVGAVLLMIGCVAMALADKNDQLLLMFGYFAMGCSGPFLQMPCFQFSELFGARKASAMAYLITCFELSTGVFWVFGELHAQLALDRKTLFLGYAGVAVYAFITALFLWPDLPYRAPPPQHTVRHMSGPSPRGTTRAARPAPAPKPLMDKPLLTQIFSVPFAYVVCFLTMHIFRQGFLLATLGPQVESFFPDVAEATQLKTAFNIILPLGFVPMMLCTASGFAAYILDRPTLAFVVVTLLSMVYGLLLLVPEKWSFFTLFVVFPVARQFVFSTFFSFSANTFGYASFGRIAGVASTVAGLCQLTQTRLVAMATDPNNAYGLSWSRVDLILGTLPVLLFIYPVSCWISQWYQQMSEVKDYSDHGVEDEDRETAPLVGDQRYRDDRRHTGTEDEDEDDGRITLPYVEATSYGSHSASSFAALYTQYMEDVKVSVVPDGEYEDRSIHVGTLPNSGSSLNWPHAAMARDQEAGAGGFRD